MKAAVEPVPPFVFANVPDNVMAPVEPDTERPVEPAENEVTPVLATVIAPAPFVIEIPVPAVKAAETGAAPVDPIRSCPFVGAAVVVNRPAVPEYKNELAVCPDTVKLVVMVTAAGKLKVTAPVEAEAVI